MYVIYSNLWILTSRGLGISNSLRILHSIFSFESSLNTKSSIPSRRYSKDRCGLSGRIRNVFTLFSLAYRIVEIRSPKLMEILIQTRVTL